MSVFAMLVLQDDGLTFREVVQNIPHDGPAIVIYLMLALFAGLVWAGSRNSGGGTPQDGSADTSTHEQGRNDHDRA